MVIADAEHEMLTGDNIVCHLIGYLKPSGSNLATLQFILLIFIELLQ